MQVALLSFALPLVSLADEVAEHMHDGESDAVAVDPVLIISIIGVAAIGAFVIWKFSLQKK